MRGLIRGKEWIRGWRGGGPKAWSMSAFISIHHYFWEGVGLSSFVIKINEKIETGVSPLASCLLNAAFLVVTPCCNTFHWLSLLKLKLDYFSAQGLNNIIHIDFDYKKEFIYWVDSTRPSGRKINRMRLNGSDLKVPPHLDAVSDGFRIFLPHTQDKTCI